MGADAGRLQAHVALGRRASAAAAAAAPAGGGGDERRAAGDAERDADRAGGDGVARQRPATANGVVFMLLEDEYGQANLIVPPPVYERYRAIVRGEPLLLARGKLERHGRNVNLLVASLESLGPLAREAASEAEVARRSRARTTSVTADVAQCASPRWRWSLGLACVREVVRRVDEPDVRERLREVAEQPLRRRVVLLRRAGRRRCAAPSSRSKSARASSSRPCSSERVDEPERARQEHALAARQAVDVVRARSAA